MRLLVKRCVPLSVSRSLALVASAAVEIVVAGIAAAGIVADVTRARVRLLVDASRAEEIRGWIRCASGLLRVVRGRLLRMTKLWI